MTDFFLLSYLLGELSARLLSFPARLTSSAADGFSKLTEVSRYYYNFYFKVDVSAMDGPRLSLALRATTVLLSFAQFWSWPFLAFSLA